MDAIAQLRQDFQLQSTAMTEGPARLLFGPTGRVVLALGLVLCAASRFLLRLFS